ncbi:MAG: hypothetical protein HUU04_07275 [Verrucomicrobiae bacterium]|nr:hypothetical protein [Verrucomicrobiae bacterium]
MNFRRSSFLLGALFGLLAAGALNHVLPLRAQEARGEVLSQEEIDKRLDGILESQKKILERLETVTTQTQFLKASSGK